MRSFVGLDSLAPPEGGSAITIGTFDGLHVGHRALVQRVQNIAAERGGSSCVLTWDRHPASTLRPDKVPPLLTSPERRFELIEDTGVDILVVLPFDDELSHWPPERFVNDVLVKGLGATAVVVGKGWRFGHKAAGDVALLEKLGGDLGFQVGSVETVEISGERVSSSRVRRTVASGDMGSSRELLGRPFDVDGIVVRGDDRGASLGFPTANLEIDPALAHPPRGVYAGRARVENDWFKAAINIGVNPTFGGDPSTTPLRIEAFVLDFSGDLYGQVLRVEFHERLRDEIRFGSVDELVAQIAQDVAATERLIGG